MARFVTSFLIALAALPALAQPLRIAGEAAGPAPKSAPIPAFRNAVTAASRVQLPVLDAAARAALADAPLSSEKRTQVGIARPLQAAADLRWQQGPGGALVAHLEVASPEAGSLRVGLRVRDLPAGAELRFRGAGGTALGPVAAETVLAASRQAGAYWTPVTSGELQVIEIALPLGADPAKVRLAVEGASHLATSAERRFAPVAKVGADTCHEDVACAAPGNEALARAARSVAKLVFTENGATFTCTGTLINDGDGASQVPYLYTAAHCVDSASAAATLNSFWFLDAASCGNKAAGGFKQLTGGATLLHANASSDAALLRLAERAPEGAWFSGWDATPLAEGSPVVGIHHPRGDLKKVAMGIARAATPGASGESYATASWLAGTTEPGSSGSGLFTLSGGEYVLRGGLKGGSASCAVSGQRDDPANRDYYSRLDLEAPTLRAWLAAAAAPLDDYSDMWWNPAEPGWGVSVVQHANNKVFVAWYAYDREGRATWLVSPDARWTTAATLEGTLYRTAGPSSAGAYDASRFSAAAAGTIRLAFGHADDATVTFTVDGVATTKPLARQAF